MNERKRILAAYQARQSRIETSFFTYENPAHVSRIQQRHQATLRLLAAAAFQPLSDLRVLDVGCGNGHLLRQFLQWGALPENLAGIDLQSVPVDYARRLNPNLDLHYGCASELPWPGAFFDLVCQHTVFTSILDMQMKRQVADEISRVLRRGGGVLWYDFRYDNPGNSDVRGIRAREVHDLFPGFQGRLHRVTLAPPIARRLPERLLPVLYPVLSVIPILRTHYLGLLIKP
jgi:SAM-dependent methyltransferase